MSYGSSSLGGRTNRRSFEFGRTHVVKPKGRHQATIIWLHGVGENGSSWSHLLEPLLFQISNGYAQLLLLGMLQLLVSLVLHGLMSWSFLPMVLMMLRAWMLQLHILQIFCQLNLLISSLVSVASVLELQQRFTLLVVVLLGGLEMVIPTQLT
ncbi:acyl-protein thioesterase 2-like [Iris pallida]|uniref:Acyl-protein thioesterase 2-like n=1 Tax=Iris pallida TaxID=29817 RepID=A0AAX6EEZ8_IRIPA|nr:acyl-protein thioesterase 2-like [Iris pallida]